MHRTLYILRHAKAESAQDIQDKDRPLSPEGQQDALALSALMQEKSYNPDFILCSPAIRTQQTCALISHGTPVIYDERIYQASTGGLYEILKNAPDKYESIMLVGHNPGVHGLARALAGSGNQAQLSYLTTGYPPASLTVLKCPCENWETLELSACHLLDFQIPRQSGS